VPTFSSFDGRSIVYDVDGSGPAVVLLHGFTGRRQDWALLGVTEALVAGGSSVVTMDLRGHGESAAPHDTAAYQDRALARDVVALADHLGLDSYGVVGYSLGSIVAATVVGLDGRVRSVVLAGIGDHALDRCWRRPGLLARALTGDVRARASEPMAAAVLALVARSGGDPLALAGVQHGHVPIDVSLIAAAAIPTLVLCGSEDRENGDPAPIAESVPMASLVEVPGDHYSTCGSAAFTAAVVDFIGRVGR
jgi:pimeloyl-ACP methyl ester carboxylesterase